MSRTKRKAENLIETQAYIENARWLMDHYQKRIAGTRALATGVAAAGGLMLGPVLAAWQGAPMHADAWWAGLVAVCAILAAVGLSVLGLAVPLDHEMQSATLADRWRTTGARAHRGSLHGATADSLLNRTVKRRWVKEKVSTLEHMQILTRWAVRLTALGAACLSISFGLVSVLAYPF